MISSLLLLKRNPERGSALSLFDKEIEHIALYYFLSPPRANTSSLLLPPTQTSVVPSVPSVICLILMSCFVSMPSFSSPLLSFHIWVQGRCVCLLSSAIASLFILWYFCYQFPSQIVMYVLSPAIYQSSGGFSPLHTIYELFLLSFYLWMLCSSVDVTLTQLLSLFNWADRASHHVLCDLTHTHTWQKMIFSVSGCSGSYIFSVQLL